MSTPKRQGEVPDDNANSIWLSFTPQQREGFRASAEQAVVVSNNNNNVGAPSQQSIAINNDALDTHQCAQLLVELNPTRDDTHTVGNKLFKTPIKQPQDKIGTYYNFRAPTQAQIPVGGASLPPSNITAAATNNDAGKTKQSTRISLGSSSNNNDRSDENVIRDKHGTQVGDVGHTFCKQIEGGWVLGEVVCIRQCQGEFEL